MAIGSDDDTIRIWKPDNESSIRILNGHIAGVKSLTNLPNGNLASGDSSGCINIWDTESGSLIRNLSHTYSVLSFAVLPNGNLASGSSDGTINIWDYNENILLTTLQANLSVYSVAVLKNGHLASEISSGEINIWNTYTGHLITTLTGHAGINNPSLFAILQNGYLVSGGTNTIKIWN